MTKGVCRTALVTPGLLITSCSPCTLWSPQERSCQRWPPSTWLQTPSYLILQSRSLSCARGVPQKDPDNLVLAIWHHIQLPDDTVASLGPAEPEHLLLQGRSGKGATVRVDLHLLNGGPLLRVKGAIQGLVGRVHFLGNCLALVAGVHFIIVICDNTW